MAKHKQTDTYLHKGADKKITPCFRIKYLVSPVPGKKELEDECNPVQERQRFNFI